MSTTQPLDTLIEDGLLDDVLGRLKSGKEADVFQVVYRGKVVAAKVYKDRDHRAFQHNSAYKEGRAVGNSRTQRAISKGSRFGRDEDEDEWKASEARCLNTLYTAGVRVPVPVLFYEGVLLMELVTDAEGFPAPRLIDAQINPAQAMELYRDLRSQIIKMLCCDLVHGDLSPYNVLLAANGPTIIDFPQTISAAHNSQSEMFFRRDFDSLFKFFSQIDRRVGAHFGDSREIWKTYLRRELLPDFVPPPTARDHRPESRAQGRPDSPQNSHQGGHQGGHQGARQGAPADPRSSSAGDGRNRGSQGRGPSGGGPRPGGPARAPSGPVVSYVNRTGNRESGAGPTRPGVPVQAPRPAPPPDGNPHRRRKRKGS